MSGIKSVLFVCTGNSCRSVMAEMLLKKYLKAEGKSHIKVSSAGIGAIEGFSPTAETIEVMKEEGIDVKGFKSTKVSKNLIKDADLILVMEPLHKQEVIKAVPEAASKIYLLKEFGLDERSFHPEGFSIPDPIGRSIENYEYCLEMIKKEIERIAKLL